MRYVAGELLNFLEQARLITPSPALDGNFPVGRLYDGYADAVAAYGSNTASPSYTVDLALKDKDGNDNGNLDSWPGGVPAVWTKTTSGTGTVVETTTVGERITGSAAKLSKGSGSAKISKIYRVRTGQRLRLSAPLRRAAAGVASLQIRDLLTGKYLTSASGWQTAQAYVVQETATSYTETVKAFTVEDWRAHADQPITYLELEISDTGAGGGADFAFADDIFLFPHWNALIIPPFYAYLSTTVTKRWARVQFNGTQSALSGAIYLPELVVTYLETGAYPNWGFTKKYLPENVVNTTPGGKVIVSQAAFPAHNIEAAMAPELRSSNDNFAANNVLEASITVRNSKRRRVLTIQQQARTDAEAREVLDELHGRCHGAQWPIVVVPVDGEDTVLFGRLDEGFSEARTFLGAWDSDLVISDNPFPRVVPA